MVYRYIQLKNTKLVELALDVEKVTSDAWQNTIVCTLPDSIVPLDAVGKVQFTSGTNYFTIYGNQVNLLPGGSLDGSQGISSRAIYLSKQ